MDYITKMMNRYGWTDLWYANPVKIGFEGEVPKNFGPRWVAGVESGPDGDLVTLIRTENSEEAEKYLSSPGETPQQAVRLSVRRIKSFIKENPNLLKEEG